MSKLLNGSGAYQRCRPERQRAGGQGNGPWPWVSRIPGSAEGGGTYVWHSGQKKVDRPPWTMRFTTPLRVPQAQDSPSRP